MRMKNFKLMICLFLFLFYLGMEMSLFAQPGNPPIPEEAPISGIGILILLGGALGIKKIIDFRKLKK